MNAPALAIESTGLVTPVGLSAPASCAAFRAKLTNPGQTRFMNAGGDWIMAHQVPLEQPWRGVERLAQMVRMAIEEAVQALPAQALQALPLILCTAEPERPGRLPDLDQALFERIQTLLGIRFSEHSLILAQGKVAVAAALAKARQLIAEAGVPRVLVAAADSLLSWPALSHYERAGRLLAARNSNGFMPGEAAGAFVVGRASGRAGELLCTGIGFAHEAAGVDSELPLRAEGLVQAIRGALGESGLEMHALDFRIADLSGEQYHFKEAALALTRLLRVRKERFDIWHPAECTGEIGAASGASLIAAAKAACDKGYTEGPNILLHLANDGGQRAALTLQFQRVP